MSEFRTEMGLAWFKSKYAMFSDETWAERCRTVVETVCSKYLSRDEMDYGIEMMRQFKWLPGGRYIYYGGREAKYYNNCFGGEAKILTDKGWVRMIDVACDGEVNPTVNILSPVDGSYRKAKVHCHGIQTLNEITFGLKAGRSKLRHTVRATRTHRWILSDGSDTYDLRVGDLVPANAIALHSDLGFAHGFIFGDGNSNGQVRLCGDKAKHLPILGKFGSVTYPKSANGDPVVYIKQPEGQNCWKSLPSTIDGAHIGGFIRGWLAADGSETQGTGYTLSSTNKDALDWFRIYAPLAGVVVTGDVRSQTRDVTLGGKEYKDHTIYIQSYSYGSDFPGFKVLDISSGPEEPVYCPYEPEYEQFITDHGIVTGNCYLLIGQEDTREEWARLLGDAASCLLTGGGVGADYSIFRGAGLPLTRTGGVASGPIPLIEAVNDFGRRARQGGGRRSALYASLDKTHGDIWPFLTVKDWKARHLWEGGPSYWQVKMENFDADAPLDMTNISVNYADDWVDDPNKALDPVFLKNIEMAMRNGEPGFSFNFGKYAGETARNACTEITSSDDSDVCNLASLNMARIEDVEEFMSISDFVGRFCVCGSMEAEVPYDRVRQTREKNRRLGQGIMGYHEWLLQRDYRYEYNHEVGLWLTKWEGASQNGAKTLCDSLGVSRPVAYRAIAPTGTIAGLAGTTSGIEPIFAVAYKRRWLDGETRKYQYYVDHAAQTMIDNGHDPDSIESSLDLADDVERRLSVQYHIQQHVDMAISSTINLPPWGTELNNRDRIGDMARLVAEYAPGLRGLTFYPDGSRGGQPLSKVDYKWAKERTDVYEEQNDACRDGLCGI